jgi:23S rRNA pseudouridine1911/1915/1917 synthase
MRFMEYSDIEADDYNDSADLLRVVVPKEAAGGRLDAVLAQLLPDFSRSRLAKWIDGGRATLDGKIVTPKTKVRGGEAIEVATEPDPTEAAFKPEAIAFHLVHEDNSIVVIDKAAGLVVHPAAGNWSGTLLNGLLHRYPDLAGVPRAGIVHRLDKDTSGLMVVARTLRAQTELVRQLQARTVKRHYFAVVQGVPARDGRIDAPIGRHTRDRMRMAVVENGKPAITHYKVITRFARHALVECKLETGRTHQIRVHMAHIGHPLVADPVYGRVEHAGPLLTEAARSLNRQALHAAQLALIHPDSGEEIMWRSDLPADIEIVLAALREEER